MTSSYFGYREENTMATDQAELLDDRQTRSEASLPASRLMRLDEFVRRPNPIDGSREELVAGKVFTMPPPRFRHGQIQVNVAVLLKAFVKRTKQGQVVTETGLITRRDPDSVRGPDVAYWSCERLPLDAEVEVYPDVAADLCVEVLSPNERPRDVQQKLHEYFECGVRMVWVVDPDARSVTIYRKPNEGRLLWDDAHISGDDVLPGGCVTGFSVLAFEGVNT